MLRVYYIPIRNDNSVINAQADILYYLLSFSIPWTFWSPLMEDYNRINTMLYYCKLGNSTHCDTSQCYFNSKFPEILDCIKTYMNENDMDMILKNI